MALAILSTLSARDFHAAVSDNDVSRLTRVPGIGRKTAERLIERAKEVVEEIEREYPEKIAEERREAEEKEAAEEKLAESDVFEDDKDFVVDEDDMPEVTAPEIDDVEDEEVQPGKETD